MKWFRMYSGVLNDPKVQRLQPDEFKSLFMDAIQGKKNIFSGMVHPETERLPPEEWAVIRRIVFERDDYRCQYCGARGVQLHCDHVIPVSRGGSNEIDNLAAACRECNQSKYNKTQEEWLNA